MRPNSTERGQARRGQPAALALPVYRCGHETIECIATQSLPGMAAYSRFGRAADPVYACARKHAARLRWIDPASTAARR